MAQRANKSQEQTPAQNDPRLEPFLDTLADLLTESVKRDLAKQQVEVPSSAPNTEAE